MWPDVYSYKHGVISDLLLPSLLRNVRSEIQENISFTPKETDIYRIDQSGDLANLDGLDKEALRRLPSIQTLRDALYSSDFREYLSIVTGSGPLSGIKTDMAINVYTHGCHLLCHDDVIGSRRVSYILYLTDPDNPWKKEWGGALRLYPTQIIHTEGGEPVKVPSPDHSISIPPAFNQLSFFAVQPGESFHDVEEVYSESDRTVGEPHSGRVRTAISGWYHIPQRGEDGFVEGLEGQLAKSSLMQLQSKVDRHDRPQGAFRQYTSDAPEKAVESLPTPSSQDDAELTKEDLDFLLKYLNPHYLTPDTLESVTEMFAEESFLLLDMFLSRTFSDQMRAWVEAQETFVLPAISNEIELETGWKLARPPHKHRYLYQQPSDVLKDSVLTPMQDLLKNFFPSKAFWKWLQIATGLTVKSNNLIARRFRRGHDYTLAQRYDETVPGLETCLSLTPTKGWGDDQDENEAVSEQRQSSGKEDNLKHTAIVKAPEVGGYLAYMAGDDDEDDAAADAASNRGVEALPNMSTGGRATKAKKPKMDPAIYQAQDDDEEDPILFHMSATWNQLGIVLRDKGTMRFVKYVSRQAKGDRWDLLGEFEIEDPAEGDEDGEEGALEDENADDNGEKADDNDYYDHDFDDSNESSEP